jgi:hypothetical protein
MPTLATFAGLVCSDVRFLRTRGYDADVSVVEIPVVNFPDGLELRAARAGEVGGDIKRIVPDAARLLAKGPLEPLNQSRMEIFAGTLCMFEAAGGVLYDKCPPIHPLYVTNVERVRASKKGGVARMRVTLVDERYFWGRGHLFRHSYNRVRADNTLAPDSVRADGSAYSLAQICDEVAAAMIRGPKLAEVPEAWKARKPPLELPPVGPPGVGLSELVRMGGAEPPCLRLDGSLAFHRLGDGRVGWALGGAGRNTQDLPPDLRLWKQGTGEGYSIELSYPDDYVIVRGKERVQTVRLDDAEPVLVLQIPSANPDRAAADREIAGAPAGRQRVEDVDGADDFELGPQRVLPLTDPVVRALTSNRLNLAALRRWVMQPRIYQDAVGLEDRIARVLRDQAWRLWRIPKVVIYDDALGVTGAGQATPAEQKRLDELREVMATTQFRGTRRDALTELQKIREGIEARAAAAVKALGNDVLNPASKPGPNANLLPLLACAETVDGRRVPLVAHTYRHRARHTVLVGKGEVSLRGTRARQRMNEIEREANTVADLKQEQPVRAGGSVQLSDPGRLTLEQLGAAAVQDSGATLEDFRRAVEQMRMIERMRALDGALATAYEQELRTAAEATSQIRGTSDVALLDLAKKAVAFEESIRAGADEIDVEGGYNLSAQELLTGAIGTLTTATQNDVEKAQRRAATFRQSIQTELRAIAARRDQQRQQSRSGVAQEDTIPPEHGPIFIQNLPRTRDHGARVYSSELGIFEVSSLPGHITPPGSPEPACSEFVPMPVAVTFGAVVRPKPGDSHRTGERKDRLGDLADEVTWFIRCFKRGPNVGDAIPLPSIRAVPPGEGTVIPIPENELVPIHGEGNTKALEEEAFELARERFRVKPRVESASYVVARPWPVNCDGVVRGIEIVMRPGGKGFETRISVGGGTWDRVRGRSRLRPRPARDVDDGRNREGLTP